MHLFYYSGGKRGLSFVLMVFNLGCCRPKECKLLGMLTSQPVLININAAGRLTQAARQRQEGVGRQFSPAWLKYRKYRAHSCCI